MGKIAAEIANQEARLYARGVSMGAVSISDNHKVKALGEAEILGP